MRDLYSSPALQEIAKAVGFIQRTSKLTAQMYLDLMLFNVFDNGKISLNDHSVNLLSTYGIQVRRQSLHERFNEGSVAFMRTLLEYQLNTQICKRFDVPALKKFSSVKIKDSTRFQVSPDLKEAYPGSGGAASEAGVHIQLEFDLCSGKVSDLHITDALHQDSTDALDTVDHVEEGSLLLRDLGYFSTEVLEKIDQANAYYITRLKPKIKIFTCEQGEYVEVDLKKIHLQMKQQGLSYRELDVYVGANRKIPVRLLIEPMAQGEVNKRLAKAGKEARKKGRMVSDAYKTYAALNLFITNVPLLWLPAQQIRTLYRLRWQIELRFKTWKSYCRIHATKKMNVHRFRTYLYACLLFVFISWEISNNLLTIVWQHKGKLVSINKCFKAIVTTCSRLKEALYDPDKLCDYIEILYELSRRELLMEKRKNHLSQEEIFLVKLQNKLAVC